MGEAPDNDEEQPDSTINAARMAPWQQVLLSAAGFVAIGVGAVAVFIAPNDLGSVSLVAVGAVLVGLGVLGLVPRRFYFGPLSVEAAQQIATQRAVQEVLEVVEQSEGTEVAQAVAERLPQPPLPIPPSWSSTAATARRYMIEVFEAVNRAAPGAIPTYSALLAGAGTVNEYRDVADVMLELGGKLAYVEVAYLTHNRDGKPNPLAARRIIDTTISRLHRYGGRWLIVANTRLQDPGVSGLTVVQWRDTEDDAALANALRAALDEASRPVGQVVPRRPPEN